MLQPLQQGRLRQRQFRKAVHPAQFQRKDGFQLRRIARSVRVVEHRMDLRAAEQMAQRGPQRRQRRPRGAHLLRGERHGEAHGHRTLHGRRRQSGRNHHHAVGADLHQPHHHRRQHRHDARPLHRQGRRLLLHLQGERQRHRHLALHAAHGGQRHHQEMEPSLRRPLETVEHRRPLGSRAVPHRRPLVRLLRRRTPRTGRNNRLRHPAQRRAPFEDRRPAGRMGGHGHALHGL